MRKVLCGLVCLLWVITLVSCGGVSSGGNPTLTPAQEVAAAKAALAIGYASGDSSSSVTQNLTLPTAGLDGTAVSWTSSNTAVISNAGVVTQPDTQDASVTLTATISITGANDTKVFPITVKAKMTDAQAVAAAKVALVIGYASGDSASSVTQNLTLPATGIDGSSNTWVSNNTAVVSNTGVVTRPVTSDASVTITATITVGSASDTKAFPITVKAQMTDAQAVAAAKEALAIGYATGDSASSVTQNLTLPATGIDNSTMAWVSSDTSVVSNAGVVTQPVSQDASVTMTATITVGTASDTKPFPITVKAQTTDAQAVAAEKTALAIRYALGDSALSVTQNLTLSTSGVDATTVAWVSSDSSISNTGVVTRPLTGSTEVSLTATITRGTASDTKVFNLVVKPQLTDTQAVAAAKAGLAITYASGDSASSVTQNLTLPATGLDNSTITWLSSDTDFVSNAGVVSQPQTQDASVTMTATITVGSTNDTKAFPITVNAQLTDAQAVAAAKAALTITFGEGESAAGVTQNLTLPASGVYGTSITWSSSDPIHVSNSGVVNQPATADVNATLTATITLRAASDTKDFPLTVKARMTEAQALARIKGDLEIGYADGDSANSVTQNLTLLASGPFNSTISWASNTENVVSDAGVVTQPLTGDASVTMTATITVGSTSDTKDFPITVKAQMSDAQAVAAAKAALEIDYQSGDGPDTVTRNLSLTTSGLDGTTISWASSDPALAIDGTVTRPVTGDLPVTLTATITSNTTNDTKVFIVTVRAQMTDAEAVAAAIEALQIRYTDGDSAVSVTQNVTLPLTGASGTTIGWASSDEELISTEGIVQRPSIGTALVTLTATVTSHEASDSTQFTLTVVGQMSDQDAVAAAKAALLIGYADGDSAGSITQNLALPLAGLNACTIRWQSNAPEVVTDLGVVTQPLDNPALVTMTATIASHNYSDTKDFSLTVNPVMSDAAAVALDKAGLTIGYGPGDTASRVTGNISLPTSGTNGSTITWSSSAPEVISESGGVTVPSDVDANVTMTATITKGENNDTAGFALTVRTLLNAWINNVAISPGSGAIEVDPEIVVRIPFQLALDPLTVNDTTFQMVQTSNSQNVPIVVTYDAPSKTVSLAPADALAQNTQYSAVVGTGLRDASENSLSSALGFSFTTLSYADILSQWKFNGNGNDASGNGNVLGEISGTFDTHVVHEGSASLYLNGSQKGTSNINLGSQLTVAVWVNVDNPIKGSINTIMANTDTGEESNGFKLCINHWMTSDESVVIEVGDELTGGKWITQSGLIQPGSWYHLAFVIDRQNQSLRIYYNGAPAPLTFTSDEGFTLQQFDYTFNTDGPFTIGSFPSGAYGFKGHLDDMRVYNRVLSDDEIAKIAQEN